MKTQARNEFSQETKAKVTPEFTRAYKMLNPEQKKAVDSIEGPVMVIAGPGTGKTQILTLRIANILRMTDTPPESILALTFTESAAANMKKRLVSLIGPAGYRVRIHTFHGFANSLIQENPDAFPRFVGASALSDIEKLLLVVEILDEKRESFSELTPFYDRHAYAKDIVGAISALKRDAVLPNDFAEFIEKEEKEFFAREDIYNKKTGALKREFASYKAKLLRSKELATLYKEYEKALLGKQRYDFEDMILEVVKALKEDRDFKLQIQEEFLYVLADEHQDANDAQNALLELLTDFHESPNLFIVGDEKQAIYRFQGASLQNFLYFKDKFKDVTLVELKNSYRSGQEILDAAHTLMQNASGKIKRVRLQSKASIKNASVILRVLESDELEAAHVAQKVKLLIEEGVEPSEIALIYRTNADAEIFAKALARERVAFNIESDANALEDTQIKKLLILLDAIADFGNDEKLAKALHLDFLELDELDIYKAIKAYRKSEGRSLHDVLLDEKLLKKLDLKKAKALSIFVKRVKKYAKRAKQEPISEVIPEIMQDFGFLAFVLALPQSLDTLEKLRALLKDAETMQAGQNGYFLPQFLEHLELLQKHGLSINKSVSSKSGKRVRLFTAHRSKGLEFEYVFLLRAYDGKWGSRKSMDKFILPTGSTSRDEEDEDERRLFFVALTRAKLAVFISFAEYSESGKERLPSKFISEIDANITVDKDTSGIELGPEYFLQSAKSDKSIFDLDFLHSLLMEHRLSVTALNNFLKCPWNYFYSNLIRIPKMQTKYMLLGNALHFALYLLHEDANKGKVKDFEDYLGALDEFVRARAGSDIVYEETSKLGKEYLRDWYDTYSSELGARKTLNEYRIDTELALDFDELPKIRLTGILDKVEFLDKERKLVRVVDYKTGKVQSRNKILGKTKSEGSGDYFRQLLFYKLLLELEGKYKMQEGVIDFLQKKDNGKMVREVFDMQSESLGELKEQIENTIRSIWNFDFWDSRCDKHKQGKCEYCALRDLVG